MRIILLVVFYIAAYAARIAAGDIATTIPGNSVKYILKQKTRTTQGRLSEVPVDDGIAQKIIKRGKQFSLVNHIDDLLQTRRFLNGKSTRVKRSPRGRMKRARNSNEVARRRDDFENDDDTDADNVWSNVAKSRGLPVWQVPESSVPSTTTPTIRMENPENFDSDRSSRLTRTDEAILPLTYSSSREMLYEPLETSTSEWETDKSQNRRESEAVFPPRKPVYILSYPDRYVDAIDGSFSFPKASSYHFPNSKTSDVEPEVTSHVRSLVSGKSIERVFVPMYRLGTLADAYSPRLFSGHQETPLSWHNDNKEKSQVKDNRASSFRRFLLIPVSKDLYVLKDADDDSRPRASADGGNATSAVLAFKAHLHHDAKDVGRAYLRGHLLKHQHRLPDRNASHSHPDLDSAVLRKENVSPAGELTSYTNFLYPEVSSQTYPGLIDAVSEISDEEIALQTADLELDHRNFSSVDSGVDLDAEISSYAQSKLSSTSSSFDTLDYDVSSYPENANDRRSHIFGLDEVDRFGSNGGSYEKSSKYGEFDVESSTMDLSKLLNTLNNDIDALITVTDAGIYVTDDDKAWFSEFTTEVYSPDNPEDHTTSMSFFSDAEGQSSKRGQTEVENSRAFLTAIEPLSSELQRLLSAVKLVNKSISDVQSRLCDKKNVVGSSKRDHEEEKIMNQRSSSIDKVDYYDPVSPTKNVGRQFRRSKRIESRSAASHEETDNTKLRKRSNGYSVFLNKLTTPSRRYADSISDSGTRENRRDFSKESNQKKSFDPKCFDSKSFGPKSSDSKSFEFTVSSSRLRLNRKLKSLTRNHEGSVEPRGRFVGPGLKKMTYVTIAAIENEVSNESDFLDRRVPNFLRHSNRSILLSRDDKDNPLLSNSKRDLERYGTTSTTSRRMYSPIDPELYKEATAYLDVLRLLNMTEEPRTEYPIIADFTTPAVTTSLTPAEVTDITTMYSPRPEAGTTTVVGVTKLEELPEEVTELIPRENETDYTTDFEYYEGIDYGDRNYTEMYGDENVTSWYEYTEEITSETEEVSETIIKDIVFGETTRRTSVEILEIGITATTKTTIWYTSIEYPFPTSALITTTAGSTVTPEIWETATMTQVPVTWRAFTVSTTLLYTPLFYTTRLPSTVVEVVTPTTKTVTDKAIVELTTEMYTTEAFEITTVTPITEKFTIEPMIMLTPLLEDMTDITLKITVPAITEILSLVAETVTTEGGITATMIASSPTILESTIKETTLSTLTETIVTISGYLTPEEEESPVTQIEKTITAEEMTTESPTTTEIPTTTETPATTETLTTSEISTTTVAQTTKMPTIIEITTARRIPTTTRTPTTIGALTTARVLTTTKIWTTTKELTIKETSTTRKTLTTTPTTTKVPTTIKTPATTKIPATIKTSKITKILTTPTTTKVPTTARTAEITMITGTTTIKILTITGVPTTIEVSTTTTTPTTSEATTTKAIMITTKSTTIAKIPITTVKTSITTEALTTIETLAATETSTTIETRTIKTPTTIEFSTTATPTTSEAPITTESTTIAKTPTITVKTSITTEALTTTEILAATETLTTIETRTTKTSTTIETLSSTETSTTIEVLTSAEIPTTSESPSIAEIPTTTEVLTTTEIPETIETPSTVETPTTVEVLTTTEISTITGTPSTVETPTTVKVLTTTEISTTTEIPLTVETPTTVKVLTTTEISTITETPSTVETPTTVKVLTTTEISTTTETPLTVETPTITEVLVATEIVTISETPITTESTTTKILITTIETTEESPTTAETITAAVTLITTETQTTTEISPATETSTIETPTTMEISTTTETSTITEILSTTVSITTFSTIFSTFLTETTVSTISPMIIITTTTSPIEILETITTMLIPTTVFIKTSPIMTYTTINATVPSTTASIITTEILESTSPLANFTTLFITKIPVTTVATYIKTTPEEYEEYYYETSTEEETTATTRTGETGKESTTISTTTEEIIAEMTTTTYLPSPTIFFTETITETTSLVSETVTSPFTTTITAITPAVTTSIVITEETTTIEEATSANFTTVVPEKTSGITFTTEEISTSTEVISISTEKSTVSEEKTITSSISFMPTIFNVTEIVTPIVLPEATTETAETITEATTTITLSPTTEYEEVLELVTTETFTPFIESTLITIETPVTRAEITYVLPETVSETKEFTTTPSTTERYTTSFIETTVHLVTSTLVATTEAMPEVETEYYVDKALEPQYEGEEEEEYDTDIPTDKWYYYDEYDTTTKERTVQEETVTTSRVSYTTLLEERVTSPSPLIETVTTLPYETKTSEFATSPTISETATIIRVVTTSTTLRTPPRIYVDEEVTSTVALETSTVVEKIKTLETTKFIEFTEFTTSEKEEATTTAVTFGSTEEYTLPLSTILEITTKPLESLTIPAKYTEPDWLEFITKPEEISDREVELEKTTFAKMATTSESVPVEKTTFVFVSPMLTTLSEEELMDIYATTVSSVFPEYEIISYEVTTQPLKTMSVTEESTIYGTTTTITYTDTTKFTTEEILPYLVTPFTVPEIEAELTTMSKIGEDVVREEQKKRLLQEFDELTRHEKEMAEREERLKEKERQWDREKKRRKEKMMQREGEAEETTTATSTIAVDITFIVTGSTTITVIDTEAISTENLTVSTATTLEITPSVLDTTFATLSTSVGKMITAWTETTSFYTTEKSTSTMAKEEMEEMYTDYITKTTWLDVEREYDKEIENLKKQLHEKKYDLEEREKMLLERERRLEEDMEKFEKYMEELEREEIDTSTASFEESTTTSEESTAPTSLTTPVPPTEMPTTARAQVTMPVEKTTEKEEARTTVKMVTPRRKTTKAIEEKKRTTYVPEEGTTPEKEEEIVTKRICLNVLANTTIPYEKRRRNVVTKKICLPYFPERKEVKKKKKSVGRLGRKILAVQVAREIEEPRVNFLPGFRREKRRRVTENTRKISNLQLLHREWLSNEITKSLRHFKGFTRMYEGTRRIFPKNASTITNARRNGNGPRATTSLYERHVLDRQESSFPTTTAMSGGKGYRKRSISSGDDSIRKRENDLSANNDKVKVGDTSIIEEKRSDEDEFGSYTVNVLHLKYDEDEETHQTMFVKPDEDEVTIESSNKQEYEGDGDDDHFDQEFGEKNYAEEEDNDSSKKIREEEKEEKAEEEEEAEEDDYGENSTENRAKASPAHDVKILVNPSERGTLVGKQKEIMDQAWPTEKSTTYHLGGTRYWELESQVTETTDIFGITTDTTTKTVDLSITRTTCLYVVLKNERSHVRTKREARHLEENHFPATSVGGDNFLQNVTSERTLHNEKPRTKNVERRNIPKFDEFPSSGVELSALTRGRKLCGINENKLKHRVIKHKDISNIKHDDKKTKSTKSHKSRDVNSHASRVREADSCVVNKKNSDQCKRMIAKATVDHHTRMKNNNDGRNDGKLARRDVTVAGRKNKSARKTRGCVDCICDIMDVINHMKSILDRLSYPLDEIKALNCSRYKEIQEKIVISVDSDVEEDARMFPQPRYNTESLKGQKYIKSEDLGSDSKGDLVLENGTLSFRRMPDHDIISLPGLNLNVPCNRDGDGVSWLSSVSRPSYTWKRTDGIALYGFVAENGDLELRNVNAKDTGNYTCIVTYMGADNEEPVKVIYEVRLRVVTLPRYILHGEGRYRVRFCDERGLDALTTYLPLKLNNVLCEADICNAYVLTPSCSRSQITMNVLIVPSHIVKLTTIDHKHCNVFCLRVIQDKLSWILSKNLQIFLERTIIFRLPHFEQRLVSIAEKSSRGARRGRSGESASGDGFGNDIGLFSSCPAGYGLRGTHCVPCDVGTYSEDGISRCKRCPPGTYQPNHGARVCRTCTSPLTRGCYNMLWNSFSAVMMTLASLSVMLSICLLMLWLICCAKKKFCAKRIISVISDEDAFQQEKHMQEQPLIKDVSENEDQQWDDERRVKRKRGKFNINRKRRKQSEKRYEKTQVHEGEWGSHRVVDAPINCLDSYRSHEDYNNHYPKRSHRKGPRLPECDFDT